MERLQYLIDLYKPYLTQVWIVCLLCIGIFVISLGIYILSNINYFEYHKIKRLLLYNTIYFVLVYLCLTFTKSQFTWLEGFIISLFILGISLLLYILFYVVQTITLRIIKLIKFIKNNKKNYKKDTVYVQPTSVVKSENSDNQYTVTKEIHKFTSNYIKSFIKPGVTIDRLQIMKDNKEDYISKLIESLGWNTFTSTDFDPQKVAEFYYNYYIKIFSE